MNRVRRVLPILVRLAEMRKVGRKRVAVEEKSVVGVDTADRSVDTVVERDQARLVRVRRLVERVVARDPRVVLVMLRELFPEPYDAVLEVLVVPEVGDVRARVRVPVCVLPAWRGVQVKDGVDAMLGAEVDDAVEVLEALGFEYARVHVICPMGR